MQATVPEESDGIFLDSFLVQVFPSALQSKRQAQKLAKEECVVINDVIQRGGKVRARDVVVLKVPESGRRIAKVTESENKMSLGDFLHTNMRLSRRKIREALSEKCVKVNDKVCSSSKMLLTKDDAVCLTPNTHSSGDSSASSASATTDTTAFTPLNTSNHGEHSNSSSSNNNLSGSNVSNNDENSCHVYYEDKHVAVLHKPSGLSLTSPSTLDTFLKCLTLTPVLEGGLLRPEVFTQLENSLSGPVLVIKTGAAREKFVSSNNSSSSIISNSSSSSSSNSGSSSSIDSGSSSGSGAVELRFRAIVVGQCIQPPGIRFASDASSGLWKEDSKASQTEAEGEEADNNEPTAKRAKTTETTNLHHEDETTQEENDGNNKIEGDEEKGQDGCKKSVLSELCVICVSPSNSAGFLTTIDLFTHTRESFRKKIGKEFLDAGHPILGLHGEGGLGVMNKQKGLFLTLVGIKFVHPFTNEVICVNAEEPAKFLKLRETEESAWRKKRQQLTERLEKEGICLNMDGLTSSDLAKAVGYQEFGSLRFKVRDEVFVPRPASLTLVNAVEKLLSKDSVSALLDLGTGTGALLLSCLSRVPFARGLGLDIDSRCVELATENAASLNLSSRAMFMLGDFGQLDKLDLSFFDPSSPSLHFGLFDVIVCNPPYLSASSGWNRSQLKAEPSRALVYQPLRSSDQSTSAYEAIATSLARCNPALLKPGGYIVFEVAAQQSLSVRSLLASQLEYVATHFDDQNMERCLVFRKACEDFVDLSKQF